MRTSTALALYSLAFMPPQCSRSLTGSKRQLTTGLLSKDASFRLIVSGVIGVKEN